MAKWPTSKLMQALQTYAVLGSIAETGRHLGIPKSTVHLWVTKHPDLVQTLREDYLQICREEFRELLADLQAKYGDEVRELIVGEAKWLRRLPGDPQRQELLTALLEELGALDAAQKQPLLDQEQNRT